MLQHLTSYSRSKVTIEFNLQGHLQLHCFFQCFLETVKDLIRFLKREDETCDIRRQLGHAQILQNDLIHVIKQYKEDTVLWETVIRLAHVCLSLAC